MAEIYNLLCLVTIAIVFNNVIAVNYCDLRSCTIKRSHTTCKYSVSNNFYTMSMNTKLYCMFIIRFVCLQRGQVYYNI